MNFNEYALNNQYHKQTPHDTHTVFMGAAKQLAIIISLQLVQIPLMFSQAHMLSNASHRNKCGESLINNAMNLCVCDFFTYRH